MFPHSPLYFSVSTQSIVSEKRNGGLGLILLRRIMDEIRTERHNGELVYWMRKYSVCGGL